MRVNETSFSNAPFRQGIVERTEIATRTVTVRVRTGLQSAFLFNQTTVERPLRSGQPLRSCASTQYMLVCVCMSVYIYI